MSRTIELVDLPPETQTAYCRGGRTRLSSGKIPPLRSALTVGRAPSKNWRLTKATAADLAKLNKALLKLKAEPARLVDAFRDPKTQAIARDMYENWLAAGKPPEGSPRFHRSTMKNAYVARPGQSNHGWGAAIDIDEDALIFKGVARGSDEALGMFWDIAAKYGFTPIIAHPNVHQSEAWHFDHFGPLRAVYDLFLAHRGDGAAYRNAAAHVATVGAALAGTLPRGDRTDWKYVQSRALAAGAWAGIPDGLPGKMTKAALKELDIDAVIVKQGVANIMAKMNELHIAEDVIGAA
jgi:hypothetical protein